MDIIERVLLLGVLSLGNAFRIDKIERKAEKALTKVEIILQMRGAK